MPHRSTKWLPCSCSMAALSNGLVLSESPSPSQKQAARIWQLSYWWCTTRRTKERRTKTKNWDLHCGKRASNRQTVILTGGTETAKMRRLQCWKKLWLGSQICSVMTHCLQSYAQSINVCEMLWRMFCIKEAKCQCVVQWQHAQLAKWHNKPA